MNPAPALHLAVLLATVGAGLWSAWTRTSTGRAAFAGGLVAAGAAFAMTPPLFALLLLALGSPIDGWFFKTLFVLGGGMSGGAAFLALLTGAAAAAVGRGLAVGLASVATDDSLAALTRRLGGIMTLTKALAILVSMTAVSGALGCLGGYLLGTYNPGYYRGVFGAGDRPGFDPVAVGVGLGLSQWAAGGLAVGVVLVVVLTWHDLRCRQIAAQAVARPEPAAGPSAGIQQRRDP